MRIICDFDGTIARQDSTDLVLEALAAAEWRSMQDDWLAGRMSADACMREQIALIGGSNAELDAILDTVELDPGFPAFVEWCESRRIQLRIVSDGVDYFISRILQRHGLARVASLANRLSGQAGARQLEQPWRREGCAGGSGVCKCAAGLGDLDHGAATIFVGDGRSDFCISGHADIVFAKGALAEHSEELWRPYLPFDTFHDVARALEVLVGQHGAMSDDGAAN